MEKELGFITISDEYIAGGDIAQRGTKTTFVQDGDNYYKDVLDFDDYADYDFDPERSEITRDDIVSAFAVASLQEPTFTDVYAGNLDALANDEVVFEIKDEGIQKEVDAVVEKIKAIDFEHLEIADSEYQEEGKDTFYTAKLEPDSSYSATDIMCFQYQMMKRAGIEDELDDAGVDVRTFEQFKQSYEDDRIQLKIELSYVDNNGSEGIVANALYRESSTHFADVPLSKEEHEQLDAFVENVLLEDKTELAMPYKDDHIIS